MNMVPTGLQRLNEILFGGLIPN